MFWTYVIGIFVFALILGIIVLLHEGGHFIMAKRAGIMCYEFAIGMGPVIYQKKKGETVYSFRAIPIGGFVSMAGEEVESNILKGYHRCQLIVNNGIVLVDYTNLLRKRGLTLYDACVEAARNRLRPILMTTLTTVTSLIPMALFPGETGAMTQPIGLTVLGGMTFGSLMTLFVMPAIYYVFNSSKERKAAKKAAKAEKKAKKTEKKTERLPIVSALEPKEEDKE